MQKAAVLQSRRNAPKYMNPITGKKAFYIEKCKTRIAISLWFQFVRWENHCERAH